MPIHINRGDSWDKENKAPKFSSNIQPRKRIDCKIVAKPSNTVAESKIKVKTSNCHTPGAPQKVIMIEHDMLCAPKSIDFSNEGKTFEDEFCGGNPLLFSKHAWTAQSPNSDAKCHIGSSLPVLNGTNITVDSPDPTSKFYSKSPPSGYSGDPDSPDPDDLFRAMCDVANISSPEPTTKRRRSTTVITPENVHHSNSSSSSVESEASLPFVSSNSVTAVTSPDPHIRFHAVASSSRSRPMGYNSIHGVSQGRVAPRLLRLQIDNDDKSSMGSTIRQARRPSFNSEYNIKMSEKEDIFTKSMSPFKPDYDAVITKLRSSGNTKETVKTPLKNFSPSAARNPENHLSIDNFHEYEDFTEDESSIRKEDFGSSSSSSFSSTIRNQNIVHQSINGISRRSMSENIESFSSRNQNQNQISKLSQSPPPCIEPEGAKHDLESMSFIRDLRRRKSEVNISIENNAGAGMSTVRRSSDDTYDSPRGRDRENKTFKEKRNANMEHFTEKEISKEYSNFSKRVIRPSPPLLPLKSRNDIKLRYDRLQPVSSGSGSQGGDSSSHPGSSYNYRGQGVSAPTQFVKNGRTYRNVDPTEGFTPQTISPAASKPATNRNYSDEQLINRDVTDYREFKEKERDRDKEKERKEVRLEVRTSLKVSNGLTRSKEHVTQVPPPKVSISPSQNKRTVPKYFDDESSTPSDPRSPEFEIQLRSPHCDKIHIDVRNETHRPAKIRISTAAVTQMYVRTKNAKKKKRSLSYYLIRGVSLESVPEDEELVDFVEYQQVKTRRGATVSDLMKQLKKIF